MPDTDMNVMVKILTEQSKAMIGMMKTQSDENIFKVLPTLIKGQLNYSNKVQK